MLADRAWRADAVGSGRGDHSGDRATEFLASDPGRVEVSDTRLRRLCPELYGMRPLAVRGKRIREAIFQHMRMGDSRAAVVVGLAPLLVAAYTDELDCVAILRFSLDAVDEPFDVGSRLLTVNTYFQDRHHADLEPGPRREYRFVGFWPIIADFICANPQRVRDRKDEIDEQEWERARTLGAAYLDAHPGTWRDGSPYGSHRPATTAPQ